MWRFCRTSWEQEKIIDKQLEYFTYEYKLVCNLKRLYRLLKTNKRLYDIPVIHVILKCETPTEKASEIKPT